MHATLRQVDSHNWITLTLLCVLLLLVFVKTNYQEEFYNFRRILVSNKLFTDHQNSTKGLGGFGVSLFLMQAIVYSLGLCFLSKGLQITPTDSFLLFVQIFLLYTVLVISKYFIEKIVGSIFAIERFLERYIFFKITFKNFLALCLFPLIIILSYLWRGSVFFFQISLAVFLLLNLMFLGYFYQKRKQEIFQNLFYFILYLCTFEIAPYFIVYKIIA